MTRTLLLSFVLAGLAVTALAAPPAAYHLELEAHPAAAFPYLSQFGKVDIHVYAGGVRSEILWLNAFSRNAAPDVTVMNPLARMYVEVSVNDIASIVQKLAGNRGEVERTSARPAVEVMDGKVKGLPARRHRLSWSSTAYIDYWTTTAVPENPQLKRIVDQLVRGVSPATAEAARGIRGAPLYVELNFRRFRKVPLVTMKKLTMTADDEASALKRGPLYVRAGVLEKLWEK